MIIYHYLLLNDQKRNDFKFKKSIGIKRFLKFLVKKFY